MHSYCKIIRRISPGGGGEEDAEKRRNSFFYTNGYKIKSFILVIDKDNYG